MAETRVVEARAAQLSRWRCPDCGKALKEMAPGVGYYCVFCHLSVTISAEGGYALVLKDDAAFRRQSRRVPLESIRVED